MEGSHWLNKEKQQLQQAEQGMTSKDLTTSTLLGTVSEKHTYKFRCSHCSLAFKTAEKLSMHSQYHLIRESTKCRFCSRSFRSIQTLIKHVDNDHKEISTEDQAYYKLSLMNHPLLLAGLNQEGSVADQRKNDDLNGGDVSDKEVSDAKNNEAASINANETGICDSQTIFEASDAFIGKININRNEKFLGRKIEKSLNYPLEKYLDPNRPYKCEVCKESFTQKNILLVHYNSVSHLHKLKKSMKEQAGKEVVSKESLTPRGHSSSLENAISHLRKDDDENKQYKCNICKVAYSQGSTLDIHIRSVLHQTRASKLQELAFSGQIDVSKPLIEQPDQQALQEQQQKKMLTDMLSPKSLNSSGSSNPQSSPPANQISSPRSLTPQSSPLSNFALPMLPNGSGGKSVQDILANQEQHQHLAKILQNLPALQAAGSPKLPWENSSPGPSNVKDEGLFPALLNNVDSKKSSPVFKNLLENYGFELVMQFNEYHQKKRQQEEEEKRQKEQELQEANLRNAKSAAAEEVAAQEIENEANPIPEMKKSKCPICQKEFSSIWVLKAHSEEIHKDLVPPEIIEQCIKELKENREKDAPSEASEEKAPEETTEDKEQPKTPVPAEVSKPESELTPDTPFPRTSTPREKDPSQEKDQSEQPSSPLASPKIQQQNLSSENNDSPTNINEMKNAFQQAILAAQQQSQNINPMLLQLSQLQGMNPLIAMNLQPPLIPPALLQPQSNAKGLPGGLDPVMQSFLSQIQSAQGMIENQVPLFNRAVNESSAKSPNQGGIDPNVLKHMSQMSPKNTIPGSLDHKFMSMLRSMGENSNMPMHPPGMAAGHESNLLPQAPDPKLLIHLAQMGMDAKMLGSAPQPSPEGKMPFLGIPNFESPPDPKNLLMTQKPMFPQPEQAKRARTRITDEQLKVLRSNFDINNSPTEEMISKMAGQTGLPPKVIKHWFRNTLFKERQKNKDSPYNFNNPPSTMLNLEEYEKTGEPKVIPLRQDEPKEFGKGDGEQKATNDKEDTNSIKSEEQFFPKSDLRNQPAESSMEDANPTQSMPINNVSQAPPASMPLPLSSSPVTPLSSGASSPNTMSLSNILGNQLGKPNFLPHPLVPNFAGVPSSLPSQISSFLNPLAGMMSPNINEQPARPRSPQANSPCISQGKRANRTRFTDYQIKVLQEFFENNAYPKDDDLEYLSKLLTLSPRVIVVWFQNARQKARKIYENQPPIDPNEDGAGRFTRTPGLNYQCKKCLLVFQRYYELIRHQKQHCFKEEDAKRSAQAQKAAAQAAAQFSGQSGSGINVNALATHSEDSNSSIGHDRRSMASPPLYNHLGQESRRSFDDSDDSPFDQGCPPQYRREEERKITPSMFDQLTREDHHISKFQGSIGSTLFPSYPPTTPFGLLQQQSLQNSRDRDSDEIDNESLGSSPSSTKRKFSDEGETEDKDESGQPRDKRLRTTILPEQLDYLYQKYQLESNPSRKMLEQIANEVGLRKRVVQVWFQNTRARERKGQFRAHQQVINKRCPFCPALFKVRSALESHLATKHSDQYTRGEINIDALPDAEGVIEPDSEIRPAILPTSLPPPTSLSFPSSHLGESMRKYYEDTMKRYMNDLQSSNNNQQADSADNQSKEGNAALDLSSPTSHPGPEINAPKDNEDNISFDRSYDDRSDCLSENNFDSQLCEIENDEGNHEDNNSNSPNASGQLSSRGNDPGGNSKRFRTQMSTIQIKVMKSIFQYYKTPTMGECATLGDEIGLQKRVVQVWFQNARAKEKKAKLQLQQMTGQEPDNPPPPESCGFCNFNYDTKFVIQDHLFSKSHLEKVRIAIEEGHHEPESPGHALQQVISAIQQQVNAHGSFSKPPALMPLSSRSPIASLPPPPTIIPPQISSSSAKSPDVSTADSQTAVKSNASIDQQQTSPDVNSSQERMEKTLMQQIYGVGHGISSYPTGVATANPFLHPAMFSTATSGE